VICRALRLMASAVWMVALVSGLWWATKPPMAAVRAGTPTFDDAVGLAAACGCWALLGWVVLALAVMALECVPGVGRLAAHAAVRLIPPMIHRAARFVLGLAVVVGPVAVASPAGAASVDNRVVTTMGHPRTGSEAQVLPGLGRPGWNTSINTAADTDAASTGSRQKTATAVVVRPGDCLWTIAAASLGPGASNAEIAAEWPRWYAVNRQVVGPDPDLLLPGTALRPPSER
jgi:nucleoid-associated protein YgaU